MGLLNRACSLDYDGAKNYNDDPVKIAQGLLNGFSQTSDHIDYPGEVFCAFRSLLDFSKGALMLPDENTMEFYPWITIGFDRTTSRRLRIPFDLTPLDTQPQAAIEILPKNGLMPMLSIRESGLINQIHMIRLGGASKPAALIIAVNDAWKNPIPSEISAAVELLDEKLGNGIKLSRSRIDQSETGGITYFGEWIRSWGDAEAVFVLLDATEAIDALIEGVNGLDIYRARKDVIKVIQNITGRMGRFCDLKDGRIAILFQKGRLPHRDLYLHQLSTAFSSAFGNLSATPRFPAEFRKWPDERDKIFEQIPGLI